MKIIDMRCRPPFGCFLNNGSFECLDNPFSADKFSCRFGSSYPESAREKSFVLFMEELKTAGITKAVVPIRKKKESDNDTLLELLHTYPDTFIGSAAINPRGGEESVKEIKKYVTDGPCKTIIMEPGMGSEPTLPSDERIFSIYQYCEANNIPIMLSFGGFTGPDIDFLHPRSIEVVASTFPKLKLAVCHAAWPWVNQMVHLAYRFENVYIAPDIYAIRTAGSSDYLAAASYMLSDKFLYGSAYPIVNMQYSVQYYLSNIKEEVLPKVMYENARTFLGLE